MFGSKKRHRSPTTNNKVKVKREEDCSTVVTPESICSCDKRSLPCTPDIPLSLLESLKDAQEGPTRPTPLECLYVTKELGKLHPEVVIRNKERRSAEMGTCAIDETVLDGVVGTILSQNTTSANSSRAFANLKRKFRSWEEVAALEDNSSLEEAIRCAGLARVKSERIYAMLKTLKEERGSVSFEYLRHFSDDAVKRELSRFKGMGPKTISCVMLFALQRPEFPVDTHVFRICQQMNWIEAKSSRETAYEHLNATVPSELKLDLHCLLIAHGKQCHRCAARGKPQFPPKDGSKLKCPLANVKSLAFGWKP